MPVGRGAQVKQLLPIILTTVVAKWVGDVFNRGLYQVDNIITRTSHYESSTMSGTGYTINDRPVPLTMTCRSAGAMHIRRQATIRGPFLRPCATA